MSEKEDILCFTGHRHYTGGGDEEARLTESLETAYSEGYRVFISGMAEGFDMAAAEAVLRLRERYPEVRLIAAVPFRGQAAKYSTADKERYERVLAAANQITVLSEIYLFGCYYRRDDWMVERSSRIICWYDGSDGGTRYTVKSALRKGLEVINLYKSPNTLF